MRKIASVLQWPMIVWCMVYSLQAGAIEKKTREINWAHELDLSAEQMQKIDAIEAHYRSQRKAVAREKCSTQAQAINELQQQMRTDVRAVLSPEQVQKSDVVVREMHVNMQLRHAREIAHKVGMSSMQKEQFLTAVGDMQEDYQWPLDLDLRERARAHFEQLLKQYATAGQLKQWHTLQEKSRGKWHDSDEFSPACFKEQA